MSSSWQLLGSLPSRLRFDSATRTVVEGIENMPTPPSAHHEDESRVAPVFDGFGRAAMRMDPPRECLGTPHVSMTVRIQRERVWAATGR